MSFKENSIEWNNALLGDICTIKGGKRLPKGKQLSSNKTKHPYIKVKDMGENKYICLNSGFEYLDDETFESISRYIVNENDLIISIVGTIGLIGLIDKSLESANLTENCVKLIDIKNVTNDFLYYYLKSPIGGYEIKKGVVGSTQPKLPIYNIQKIAISYPSISEQKAIAKVLSDLDEKIEINNKINKKLEEMAQAIFKQWFVDFEFPNEYGKPYKSSGGEMIESELGMIPKGWEVDSLSNLVKEVITGKTPSTKKSENYGDKYPFVTIPDMHNKVFVTKTERYLSEDGHKLQEKKLIPKNSIMVSCIATVGLVSISSEAVHTNQQINSIIPNSIEEVFYFYEYLKLMEDRLKRIGSAGSATLNVNKGEFEKIKYIYPNSRIINKYNNTVKNIYEKIKLNEIENNRLAQLRDTLLPKLMSGEIRVQID